MLPLLRSFKLSFAVEGRVTIDNKVVILFKGRREWEEEDQVVCLSFGWQRAGREFGPGRVGHSSSCLCVSGPETGQGCALQWIRLERGCRLNKDFYTLVSIDFRGILFLFFCFLTKIQFSFL